VGMAVPAALIRLAWFAVTLPFITMLLVATFMVLATPKRYRPKLMLSTTYRVTTMNIILLGDSRSISVKIR
jgi:hypothetical protein